MDIKDFILKAVETHPRDLVSYVADYFNITPQAIHKHLDLVMGEGLIEKTGETRSVVYTITVLGRIKKDKPKRVLAEYLIDTPNELEEDVVWRDRFKPSLLFLPKNVMRICEYGLTEILNNARDHAGARNVWARAELDGTDVVLTVRDDGIGIFRKIKDALKLGTERESILHLSKGKFTTDRMHHTGEGIFFSSRSFDTFHISSPSLAFLCVRGEDWLFDKSLAQKVSAGTWIGMHIDVFSKTNLSDVFNKYTVDSDVPVFEKTHVVVKLGLLDEETFVSRSQAKRILLGLERFKEVLLDFKGIATIGPSFADEIFRVFQLTHPKIRLVPMNTDPDVDAVIQRAIRNLQSTET